MEAGKMADSKTAAKPATVDSAVLLEHLPGMATASQQGAACDIYEMFDHMSGVATVRGHGQLQKLPVAAIDVEANNWLNEAGGEAPAFAQKIFADKATGAGGPVPAVGRRSKVAGAFGDLVRRCLPVVGIIATSTAATALAAGTATPARGFALFVLLLSGVSLVSLGVVGGAGGHECDGDGVSLA